MTLVSDQFASLALNLSESAFSFVFAAGIGADGSHLPDVQVQVQDSFQGFRGGRCKIAIEDACVVVSG